MIGKNNYANLIYKSFFKKIKLKLNGGFIEVNSQNTILKSELTS